MTFTVLSFARMRVPEMLRQYIISATSENIFDTAKDDYESSDMEVLPLIETNYKLKRIFKMLMRDKIRKDNLLADIRKAYSDDNFLDTIRKEYETQDYYWRIL